MPGIPPGESDYRPVVYVSGVYSDEDPTSRNRTKLDEAVEMVLASNGSPVCPALLHFDSIAEGEDVIRAGLNILGRCEAVYLIVEDPASTSGAGREVSAATTWDIPVFTTEESLVAWINDQIGNNEG